MENNFFSYDEIISAQKLAYTTSITDEQIRQAEKKFNILDIWSGKEISQGIIQIMKEPEFCFWTARHLLQHNITPQHAVVLAEMWKRPFPMLIATRGWSKTYTNAMLALLKLRLEPGTRIVGVGSGFRQSKLIWEYMKFIWDKADVLRSTCGRNDGPKMHTDRATFTIGDSTATFIPIGVHGDKIRGLRANSIFVDEFDSIAVEIYEKVIVGFGAVSKDPVMSAVIKACRKRMIHSGEWSDDLEKRFGTQEINQQVITGTAGYGFGHFYKYFKRYWNIIHEIKESIDGEEPIDVGESRKNYSIIRIPHALIPEGFMDDETISRARASMLKSNFDMEYETIFALDSDGFFKKTLIDSCVPSNKNPIIVDNEQVSFLPKLKGDPNKAYVFGIDPAFANDNLSIVILELHDKHTRIVHCWSINRARFQKRIKAGIVREHDYYRYCVQKVRDLMQVFPCVRIMMDSQGGGHTIAENFANPEKDEIGIYEIIEEGKEKPSDKMSGYHILEMCNFANAKFTSEANHGLKHDFEKKLLIFPEFDYAELATASELSKDYIKALDHSKDIDSDVVSIYDTLEDVFLEIEELKKELISIEMTQTPSGVERWDTPDLVTKGKSKKKDRYSALVLANKGARDTIYKITPPKRFSQPGYILGFSAGDKEVKTHTEGPLYTSPKNNWYKLPR